ncbi:MAG: PD40 domain-containing protein, partial [Anaerolineae bacterium]|nr:PD40 domain-containing protein [Anaerolineae bacterium]
MVKWILLSALTLLGIAITPYDHLLSQDDQSPRFGRVAYLGTPDIEYSSFTLSPDGRILVANASRLLPIDASTGEEHMCCIGRDVQQVWQLSDEGNWQAAMFNPPNVTYEWVGEPDNHYEQVDALETALSFSPDGRYLAVRTFEEIQIRSVPDFTLVIALQKETPTDSIYVGGDGQIAWSRDSRFLAYLDGQFLRVLDVETGETTAREIEVSDGWLRSA